MATTVLAIPKRVNAIVKTDTQAINAKRRPSFVRTLIVVKMAIAIPKRVNVFAKTNTQANVAKPHPINVN